MRGENMPKTGLWCCQIATILVFFIRHRDRWTRWSRSFLDRKQN